MRDLTGFLREKRQMSFTDREIQGLINLRIAIDWKNAGKEGAVLTAISLFMAFINPYGAANFNSFLPNFVYWFALILAGGLSGKLGYHIADFVQKPSHWALGIFFSAITASIAVTAAIYIIAMIQYELTSIPLGEFPQIFFFVFVISVAIASVMYLFERANENQSQTGTDPNTSAISSFLERLPVKYRSAELYAISSEDHYLRVHTSLGEELILMRLADALRELAAADGLQTHRSWWVSRAGISEARRENGKLTLVLKSGSDAPVSRTYMNAVKDAGLAA